LSIGEEMKKSVLKEKEVQSLFGRYVSLVAFFLITITALLIYSNTLHSPFIFDDVWYILDNPKIRNLGNFLDMSGTRYIAFLTFALNYKLGGYNTFGYHLINVTIHIINGFLVYWLVVLTFKTPLMGRTTGNSQLKYFIALSSALIFISHPIHTQAVTYITQRFTSLSTLFYLLSLTLYIKARLTEAAASQKVKWLFYFASLLCAVLAMKTKEISFTLPLIIALYEFTFFNNKIPRIKRFCYLFPFLLALSIIPLTYFAPELGLGERGADAAEKIRRFNILQLKTLSWHDYLITQFRVIITYLRLLVLPMNQNADYDYPTFHSIFKPQILLSFLFLLFFFAVTVYLFVRSRRTNNDCTLLISFGILWFFITLSVESSIIPIWDVIFEHRLYLPSIGMVIAFSSAVFYGFYHAKRRLGFKISLPVATCVLLLVIAVPLSCATYKRNWVWKDAEAFWGDVVRKSPWNPRAHNNLGLAYVDQGRIYEALEEYEKALSFNPDYAEAHNNLGSLYGKRGFFNLAVRELTAALRIRPGYAEAHNNIGNVYYKQGRIDEAIEEYKEALRHKPDLAKAHNNLGLAYTVKGRIDEAIDEYRTALRLKSDYVDAYYNLGLAYADQGRTDEAIEEYILALRLRPDDAEFHNNIGVAYADKGQIDVAIEEFLVALRLEPYYTERGPLQSRSCL
jgi:tetratricopeptide (TPR) repeat protein